MKNEFDPSYPLVPADEIQLRIVNLQKQLCTAQVDGALILDSLNMYYYSGTMQQGILYIPTSGSPAFLVKRSYERTRLESPLEKVIQLKGFSNLQHILSDLHLPITRLGLAENTTLVSLYKALSKAFSKSTFIDISQSLNMVRAIKTEYEIDCLRRAGQLHKEVYDAIPEMIHAGISEWELGAEIHKKVMSLGFTGVTRFMASNMELFLGIVSFGESGNYPTPSVGPGGVVGLSPAFPLVGGNKRLEKHQPIFVDTGFGYAGYYTDKTRIFSFGQLPSEAAEAHQICLEIQEAVRCRLVPGAIPSQIYTEVYTNLVCQKNFQQHFMGFGSNQVSFFGHGIGLAIDEFPVIADKIHTPLELNMVVALEPKKGLEGIGMVGVENTFRVTENGGEKLTCGRDEIVVV